MGQTVTRKPDAALRALVNAVRDQVPGQQARLAATAAGRDVLERLGGEWLGALVRTASLVWPEGCDIELHLEHSEPMQSLTDTGWDTRDGLVTVTPDDTEYPSRRRPALHATLPSSDLLDDVPTFAIGPRDSRTARMISSAYTSLYTHTPLVLDSYRQWRASGRPRALVPEDWSVAGTGTEYGTTAGVRVMWVAMHWAETGGAESWAWEQARIAKEAGFQLVITFDRAAPQRLLRRALALTGDVYLVGNILSGSDFAAFVRALVARHGITDIHIHHSMLAYSQLPLLRQLVPDLHVTDSTHIAEYNGGGFVGVSAEYSSLIDVHHVISPDLMARLRDAGVPEGKIVYRPLTGFTSHGIAPATPALREGEPVRVGFLGRLSVQKRPYLFERLVRLLQSLDPGSFRFVMQGAGELEEVVSRDARRLRLDSILERRAWGPARELLQDVDVLVITSENEGLTLTALEADAAGVLVVSTDVGSQYSVVADRALLPVQPVPFLRSAAALLRQLARDPQLYEQLRTEQHRKVAEVAAVEPATRYFSDVYAKELSRD